MISVQNKVDCCGCNACGDICPKKAITFKTDIEGFWYPEVDRDKCVNCHLCEKVCPIENIGTLKKNDFAEPKCYAAINKNLETRFDSTSGGIFSALAELMYERNGYIGGAIFDDKWGVQQFISSKEEDILKLRSSKYLQSNALGFYKTVKDLVIKGEQVLVCGTPCQMAALRAFLKKPYDNIIIIDFICRGVNSPKSFRKYIDYLEDKHNSKVVYFKAKNKELGWRNLTNKVVFDNGDVLYDTKDISTYMICYLKTNILCRPSCYECRFKGMPRMADITLADFWAGEKQYGKEMDGDMGTSLVLINSKKGEGYFNLIQDKLLYKKAPFESIFKGNKALTQSISKPTIDRNAFYADMDKMSFGDLCNKYVMRNEKLSFKQRMRNILVFIYSVAKVSGLSFTTYYKNIKYNFFSKQVKSNISARHFILITKHCVLNIKKGSVLNLSGILVIGRKGRFPKSKLETRLLLAENSQLNVKGCYTFSYGSAIEIFANAILDIEGGGYTNINATIICGKHITIGKGVIMGRDVSIRDDNGSHYLGRNGYHNSKDVVIGQHVWIGAESSILPGVTIGTGSVIGAKSLVNKDVPSFTLAAGNPAKNVRQITWKG